VHYLQCGWVLCPDKGGCKLHPLRQRALREHHWSRRLHFVRAGVVLGPALGRLRLVLGAFGVWVCCLCSDHLLPPPPPPPSLVPCSSVSFCNGPLFPYGSLASFLTRHAQNACPAPRARSRRRVAPRAPRVPGVSSRHQVRELVARSGLALKSALLWLWVGQSTASQAVSTLCVRVGTLGQRRARAASPGPIVRRPATRPSPPRTTRCWAPAPTARTRR
jgi:hypothetical protein